MTDCLPDPLGSIIYLFGLSTLERIILFPETMNNFSWCIFTSAYDLRRPTMIQFSFLFGAFFLERLKRMILCKWVFMDLNKIVSDEIPMAEKTYKVVICIKRMFHVLWLKVESRDYWTSIAGKKYRLVLTVSFVRVGETDEDLWWNKRKITC